ncbi:MAG: hypothetical protein ABI400_08310 [Lacisediminihabitans sp.]
MKTSRSVREGMRLILAVAAVWVALIAVAQLYVTLVLVHQLPPSVFIYFSGKAVASPVTQFRTSDLVLVSWAVIGVYAVIVGIAALFQRRGAFWPVVAGVLVCASLPFIAAMVILSLIAQIGVAAPAASLSSAGTSSASIGGFILLMIGFLSAFTVPRWVIRWRNQQVK